ERGRGAAAAAEGGGVAGGGAVTDDLLEAGCLVVKPGSGYGSEGRRGREGVAAVAGAIKVKPIARETVSIGGTRDGLQVNIVAITVVIEVRDTRGPGDVEDVVTALATVDRQRIHAADIDVRRSQSGHALAAKRREARSRIG